MENKIINNIIELIGQTPLLHPNNWLKANNLSTQINLYAKLENYNPSGSVKDRTALGLILDLEEKGLLKPGGTIIEPTSGNTGIGLASIAAARGYKTIFTMPDTMSKERQLLLKAYGAKIHLTAGKDGMKGAIAKASELHAQIPNSVIPAQFDNPANPIFHEKTTGPEILQALNNKVDILIAGVGTGGTLTGTARALKKINPKLKAIAIEPKESAVISGEKIGKHGIQGIGAGFIPKVLDVNLIDSIIKVSTEEAYEQARLFAKHEGILLGVSSGAALQASKQFITMLMKNKSIDSEHSEENYKNSLAHLNIVVILPDDGDRYLSCGLFSNQ